MKVIWHRQVSTQLRQPQVCVVTGEQATSLLPTLFRNRTSYWLPGIGRLIMSVANPAIVVGVPVSAAVRQRATTWRLISLFGPLAGVLLGLVLALAVGDSAGGLVFFVLALASLGFAIFARMQADVFGADVNGDQISMSKAHPAFADSLARSNPPGWVQIEGAAAPQQYHQPQGSTYDPVMGYRPPNRQA